MAKLSLYLPPFSPDYSGAGSMLFDLNALTVMHDAGGCTGNYTGHDEPRWYGSKATVFCSALRMMDAIMGNDQKLKDKIYAALPELHPELIALVGSPVPTVIGMDLKGLAHEIEEETGIPTIGIETTGNDYYDVGAYKAFAALLEKFCPAKKSENEDQKTDDCLSIQKQGEASIPCSDCSDSSVTSVGDSAASGADSPISFNVLGATPLDYERVEDLDALKDFLQEQGFTQIARPGFGYDLSELKRMGDVKVNIAVSHSGFLMAKYMEKKYGIPYLVGVPFGKASLPLYKESLRTVAETGKSGYFFSQGTGSEESGHEKAMYHENSTHGNPTDSEHILTEDTDAHISRPQSFGDRDTLRQKALIIGDQVVCESLRCCLKDRYEVTVGCIFGVDREVSSEGVLNLKSEKDIKEAVCDESFDVLIADPVIIKLLPGDHGKLLFPLPQYAVSGDIYYKTATQILGNHTETWMLNQKNDA